MSATGLYHRCVASVGAALRSSSDRPMSTRRAYVTLAILTGINLLNYIDRTTIAGVLTLFQEFYDVNDFTASLINTAFLVSYLLFAPMFGYLGDRYNRKVLILLGIAVWISAVLACTFVPQGPVGDRSKYIWGLLMTRALVGVGEASYSTVAPAIIGDLFTSDKRSTALMFFYFAIPVGSGLGYVVSSQVASFTGAWYWGVRVTPIAGIMLWAIIFFVLEDPRRASAEHVHSMQPTSFVDDLRDLARNKTYILSTAGYTGTVFMAGCAQFWMPNAFVYAFGVTHPHITTADKASIALVFGGIAVATGILGVAMGGSLAKWWRRTNPRADPLVCAVSALISVPFVFFALTLIDVSVGVAYFLTFMGMLFLFFNWSITSDMVLYTVVPTRRATACAMQIMVSHLFGDATSPLIIGAVSDAIRGDDESNTARFHAIQDALYITIFLQVLGSAGYFMSALYVEADRDRCRMQMAPFESVPVLADNEQQAPPPYYANNGAREENEE